jgi:hypothetical protein
MMNGSGDFVFMVASFIKFSAIAVVNVKKKIAYFHISSVNVTY